jgi:hypothetical protein
VATISSITHQVPPARKRAGGAQDEKRVEPAFVWARLASLLIPPLKAEIFELLLESREPLSASNLHKLIDRKDKSLSVVAHHAKGLAKVGAIEVVRKRRVRGAEEKFYDFPR